MRPSAEPNALHNTRVKDRTQLHLAYRTDRSVTHAHEEPTALHLTPTQNTNRAEATNVLHRILVQNRPFCTHPLAESTMLPTTRVPHVEPTVRSISRVQNQLFCTTPKCRTARSASRSRAEPNVLHTSHAQNQPFCTTPACRTDRAAHSRGTEPICAARASRTLSAPHALVKPTVPEVSARRAYHSVPHPRGESTLLLRACRSDRSALHPRAAPTVLHRIRLHT